MMHFKNLPVYNHELIQYPEDFFQSCLLQRYSKKKRPSVPVKQSEHQYQIKTFLGEATVEE